MWECGALGGKNQKWNFSGRVRLAGTPFCLAPEGNRDGNGTKAVLATCGSSEAQVWDYYFK